MVLKKERIDIFMIILTDSLPQIAYVQGMMNIGWGNRTFSVVLSTFWKVRKSV